MSLERHLTNEERAAYWAGSLAPRTLLEVSDHLQDCAACREDLARARPQVEGKQNVSYEELVAWIDNTLDPLARRKVAERLSASPQSSVALVNLLRFRDEMDELPANDYSASKAPASSNSRWILPLAAGLTLGLAFLWLTTIQQNRRGLALNDGGQRLVVRPNGNIPALGALPPELQEAVRKATATGEPTLTPALAALRGADDVLAGAPGKKGVFAVVAPIGTLVESPRPTLRWQGLAEATAYRVNLAPRGGGEVMKSPLLDARATEWTPDRALAPNETYDWEVEALRDGEMIAKAPAPPKPEARFAVLPNEKREELEKLRQEYGRSHLVLGLVYAKAGLLPQARAEFKKLAQENPGNDLPRRLLEGLTTNR